MQRGCLLLLLFDEISIGWQTVYSHSFDALEAEAAILLALFLDLAAVETEEKVRVVDDLTH